MAVLVRGGGWVLERALGAFQELEIRVFWGVLIIRV